MGTLAVAATLLTGTAALVPSPGSAAHSAASSAGTAAASTANDLTQFAVDSPAMIHAELIAVKYWGTSPCAGVVSVSWASLDPSI
ncbi:MAG TPA: hypothetical protein VFR49_16515, partial [Solirubrobacteraceae bacterium]|nr:hypothetical protein [Solirubrobacteraceae bacterium]